METASETRIALPILEGVARVKRPPYITETLIRVKDASANELKNFIDSEWVFSSVVFAVKEMAQMETVMDELPELKSEAEVLLPEPRDWRYALVEPGGDLNVAGRG